MARDTLCSAPLALLGVLASISCAGVFLHRPRPTCLPAPLLALLPPPSPLHRTSCFTTQCLITSLQILWDTFVPSPFAM